MQITFIKQYDQVDGYRLTVTEMTDSDNTLVSILLTHDSNSKAKVIMTDRVVNGGVEMIIDETTYPQFARDFGNVQVGDSVVVEVSSGNTPPEILNLRVIGV